MIHIHVNGVEALLRGRDKTAAAHWEEARAALSHPDVTLTFDTVYRFTGDVGTFHVALVQIMGHARFDYMDAMCGKAGEIDGWADPDDLLHTASGKLCARCFVAVGMALT